MIEWQEALAQVLRLATKPEVTHVPLSQAAGQVLIGAVEAHRDQPPFAASAMDGYAVQNADAHPGAALEVIGEAAAGHSFERPLNPGQAVRIFTGAPLPQGADRVVIQEDVTRIEPHEEASDQAPKITLKEELDSSMHVRPKGADFQKGATFDGPKRLTGRDLALLAAMNIAQVPVARKPVVAILATGDELVMPGEHPQDDQIIASNIYGLKALVEEEGGTARLLPIARDTKDALTQAFDLALGADLLVTVGGASVGDHDLVGQAAAERGLDRAFYKIAMRPGKPLMAGKLATQMLLGLPGNPVSALVCGEIFLRPLLKRMQGLQAVEPVFQTALLDTPLSKNGPRAHFLRATLSEGRISPARSQDSALLTLLSSANALLYRPISDPELEEGAEIQYLPLPS
ncbi:MAG: gephyrin-like molybdotransferase Glp [Pseudomonadota bacterium]